MPADPNFLPMARRAACALALLAASSAFAGDDAGALFDTIAAQDAATFDAFNHCDQPGQLDKHASHFAKDVEFYHDTGGVTWTRDAMIANTGKNVCGHFRRQLVPGSMQVFPIRDFGAIETGSHVFCQLKATDCEGLADYTIVWHRVGDQWLITRVLSYGHRANK